MTYYKELGKKLREHHKNIDSKVEKIEKYKKYVNTELDYAHIYSFNAIGVSVNAGDILIPTDGVGNMDINLAQGTVTLKANRVYKITATVRLATGERIIFALKDMSTDTQIGQDYGSISISTTEGWSDKDYVSVVRTEATDISIGIYCVRIAGSACSYGAFTMTIQEINHELIVDPVEHVTKTNSLEDTPVGHIIAHMGTIAPAHYLICDGTTYNITDYPYLAQHIEDNFGSINYFGGDGETTFAVPDLRERFLKGSDNAGINQDAGLPNITGTSQGSLYWGTGSQTRIGAITTNAKANNAIANISNDTSSAEKFRNRSFSFNASHSNAIYGKSSTVTPANTSVLYCIKYEPTYYMQNIYTGYEEVVLYEGQTQIECTVEATKTDVTISLIDSIENYDEIKIYYGTYNASGVNLSESKILKPTDVMNHDGNVFLSCHWNAIRMAVNGIFTDASTLNFMANGMYIYREGITTSNLGIAIYRIVGCKTSYNQDGELVGTDYTEEDVTNTIDELW